MVGFFLCSDRPVNLFAVAVGKESSKLASHRSNGTKLLH